MRAQEMGKRFITGWGLPIASALIWAAIYVGQANREYAIYRSEIEPESASPGSGLLLAASIALLVVVGQRLYRSLRSDR